MKDHAFEELERTLYHAMKQVFKLQKKYRRETGRDFVPSGPLPKPEPVCNCKNDHGCFLPREK
jgi:hypothetical protein